MRTEVSRAAADLVEKLARHRMIVCGGSGGVGKTTVSAALGMAIASARDTRVLVLTIDPARRLATALGLSSIGTRPVSIAPERLRAAGLMPRGEIVAAMLDVKSAWDHLVERHAQSPEVRDRILSNRFYRGISTGFAGSQEYVALDVVYDLHASGEYGCIVLDTPPSRSALDFLEAPDRLTDFVSARLLAWLAGPSRIGLRRMGFAATPFLRMADRLLGGEVQEGWARSSATSRACTGACGVARPPCTTCCGRTARRSPWSRRWTPSSSQRPSSCARSCGSTRCRCGRWSSTACCPARCWTRARWRRGCRASWASRRPRRCRGASARPSSRCTRSPSATRRSWTGSPPGAGPGGPPPARRSRGQ